MTRQEPLWQAIVAAVLCLALGVMGAALMVMAAAIVGALP